MQRLTDKLVNYASILDWKAQSQAHNTANMPFIFPHVALMPDAHLGKGATVGSVIPADGAIMPAAVGVDIGCGMIAMKTIFNKDEVTSEVEHGKPLSVLREHIERLIPLGKGVANPEPWHDCTRKRIRELEMTPGIDQTEALMPTWWSQLGTLGGGNHFIEVSDDETGFVWLFLHSGSRGPGNKLANKHIKIAKASCKQWKIHLPDPDLAYLPEGTPEFWSYMEALRWAQKFALLNREEMMARVKFAFEDYMEQSFRPQETINCHHNYTEKRNIFGKDVWLSRKGAIDASVGARGLIPGSMGDKSYVVTGLGDRLSLDSAPHGAGRMFSRSAAKKEFTYEDLQAQMAHIEWRNSEAFLDEHPDAYKDIDVVMDDAKTLVQIDHTLRQFLNVKGE